MTSLASSPTAPPHLFNHASFQDPYPKTGILLNAHDGETIRYSPPIAQGSSMPNTPHFPPTIITDHLSPKSDNLQPQLSPASSGIAHTPKIRFAPLPDPSRPRSLSDGKQVQFTSLEEGDGPSTRLVQITGVGQNAEYDEEAVDDDEDEDDDDAEGESRGRSWSKTLVAGSWKGTKKLLVGGTSSKDEAYGNGAPLKKSVSTGGFIGASPFRWTNETERKKQFLGGTSPSMSSYLSTKRPSASALDHRRNSSLDANGGSVSPGPLGRSPAGVRMLNGRVYGSRRASEAAERAKEDKLRREKAEPAFVEWGHGKTGGGMGSVAAATTSGGGFLEEEGSGMEWVKRRREERQKREAEARAKQEKAAASPQTGATSDEGLSSSASSSGSSVGPLGEHRHHTHSQHSSLSAPIVTPNLRSTDLPPAPIIQISEPTSNLSPTDPAPPSPFNEKSQPVAIKFDAAASDRKNIVRGADVFDEDDHTDEDDGDDDGDFDDDEEEDEEPARTTASAAGIEVVSRHRN